MESMNGGASKSEKKAGSNKVVRSIVAAVGAIAIAFCGWSMSEYVQGRDPLAFALSSDALQTTTEAKDGAQAQKESKAKPQSQKANEDKGETNAKSAEKSSKKDSSKSSSKKNEGSSQQSAAAKGNGSAGDDDAARQADGNEGDTVIQEVVYTDEVSSTPEQQGGQQEAAQPDQDVEQPATQQVITISLSIDGGAGASSALLELEPGSTALDALYVAGVGIDTIPNPFGSGTWVTSIGGLAEDAGHGWTYRVNGALPGIMSDLYVLSDGDQLLWQYV